VPNITDGYLALTKGEGVAPSGQAFQWRAPSSYDFGKILGGVPGLISSGTDSDPQAGIERANEFNRKLVVTCVTAPLIRVDDAPEPEGDWVYLSALTHADISWLAIRINDMVGASSEKAAIARGSL
jgi:hypothetical protein